MAKRKFTAEERARLGISGRKKKYRENEHRPRIRAEYMDFSTDRPRRRPSDEEKDTSGLEWIAAAIIAVFITTIFVELL